jgi:hypothetical protein
MGGTVSKLAPGSAWAVDSCTRCGSTIMMGEPVVRIRSGSRHERLCQTCAARPAEARVREQPEESLQKAA